MPIWSADDEAVMAAVQRYGNSEIGISIYRFVGNYLHAYVHRDIYYYLLKE